jgi:hypothetical protein
MYNSWFLEVAPKVFNTSRQNATMSVDLAFVATTDLTKITPQVLRSNPKILQVLRMCTAPPLARDRLTGFSNTPKALLETLEDGVIPPKADPTVLDGHLTTFAGVLFEMLDRTLFPWLESGTRPTAETRALAKAVVADRLCGAEADPIIRNAQEARQLSLIEEWLEARSYKKKQHPASRPLADMEFGTYFLRMNVVARGDTGNDVNISIDAVIQPHDPAAPRLPILIEAKSAGDFANTNKRRKEEAQKFRQLRSTYGESLKFLLLLCGYFDEGYLEYSAAEGIDWVWEHRIDDLVGAGV